LFFSSVEHHIRTKVFGNTISKRTCDHPDR
jgi:hypothetical protein